MDFADPIVWLLLTLLVGAATYSGFAVVHRQFHLDRMLVTALATVTVPSGVDLIYCAFHPTHLVHLVDPNGATSSAPVTPTIGEMHRVDLVAGGLVLIAVGITEMVLEIRRIRQSASSHP